MCSLTLISFFRNTACFNRKHPGKIKLFLPNNIQKISAFAFIYTLNLQFHIAPAIHARSQKRSGYV